MESIGEGAGESDGVGNRNKGDGIGRGTKSVFEAVGDKFCIGEGIDADEMDKFAWVSGEGGDEGEGGGDFADGRILAEDGDEFFREAKALAFDGEVGSTRDEVEGGAEGAEGGFVDGLDGDDGGDADGEGGEVEKRESFMSKKITTSVGKKDAEGVEPVQELGLDTTVDEGDSAVRTGGDRLAVSDKENGGFFFASEAGDEVDDGGAGSGVEIAGGFVGEKDGGLVDKGAGDGGALELSARELVGAMVGAVGEMDGGEEFSGTDTGEGIDATGEEKREKNVFFDGESGEEVKELEDEADFQASERGEFIVVEGVKGMAFEVDLTGSGNIESTEKMEESAFAAAAGAGDGDDFSLENF